MNRLASGKIAIVGVGESDIGKVPGMTGLGLNAQAAKRALDDAGLKMSDIDAHELRIGLRWSPTYDAPRLIEAPPPLK